MANSDVVKKLKDEGNHHFAKKEFSQAYDKYTAALSKGGDNAILYANRAACSIGRRKYLDAIADANKATSLDSAYSKAWGRLGSAYAGSARYMSGIEAYRKALDCLPKDNLTVSDLRQKQQYEEGLSECTDKINNPKKIEDIGVDMKDISLDEMPWRRAEKYLRQNIDRPGIDKTSAWVIHKAEMSWNKGMDIMKDVKPITTPDGRRTYDGATNALQWISDAIIRDRRIFSLSGNWMSMYERQVMLETFVCKGWSNDVGPQCVLQEAQARVEKDGWDKTPSGAPATFLGVRKAISTKVHTWVIQAFLTDKFGADIEAAECRYAELLEFLNEGRNIWNNIDVEDRGIVFEHSFIMGVRVLHLHSYFEAASKLRNAKYGIAQLRKVAEQMYKDALIANAQCPRSKKADIGYEFSFFLYPIGEALSTIAYCELQTAHEQKNAEARQRHFRAAAEMYLQSTSFFHEDDEYHSYFLVMSLKAHWLGKSSLQITLPIMRSLREVNPKMLRIWTNSGLGGEGTRDRSIKYCLDFLDQVERKIASGAIRDDAEQTPTDAILEAII